MSIEKFEALLPNLDDVPVETTIEGTDEEGLFTVTALDSHEQEVLVFTQDFQEDAALLSVSMEIGNFSKHADKIKQAIEILMYVAEDSQFIADDEDNDDWAED